jgi:hypothetical protein
MPRLLNLKDPQEDTIKYEEWLKWREEYYKKNSHMSSEKKKKNEG